MMMDEYILEPLEESRHVVHECVVFGDHAFCKLFKHGRYSRYHLPPMNVWTSPWPARATNDTASTCTPTTTSTLAYTFAACLLASCITLPAELVLVQWRSTALSEWNPEVNIIDSAAQTRVRVLSPFIRLTANEVAVFGLEKSIFDPNSTIPTPVYISSIPYHKHILAGALAGISQALIVCPMEAYRAHALALKEDDMLRSDSFFKKVKRWVWEESTNSSERKRRAYTGIGIRATREVVFNIVYFPIFEYLESRATCDLEIFASGIVAGGVSAATVAPLDVLALYLLHSRQRWSWWTGFKTYAPPPSILYRGVGLQAFLFGPVFGIVACVYKLV